MFRSQIVYLCFCVQFHVMKTRKAGNCTVKAMTQSHGAHVDLELGGGLARGVALVSADTDISAAYVCRAFASYTTTTTHTFQAL